MVETTNKGYVCQIIGPVLDIEFPSGTLPPIYSVAASPGPVTDDISLHSYFDFVCICSGVMPHAGSNAEPAG